MLLEDREDVLEEVELLVARRGPEIVAVDRETFLLCFALLGNDSHAALLAEGRISHHHLVVASTVAGESIPNLHRDLFRAVGAYAVQQKVHTAEASNAIHQLDPEEGFARELFLLGAIELVTLRVGKVGVSREKKTAGAASWVANSLARLRPHHVHDSSDQLSGGKTLDRPPFYVLSVLLQQAFVGDAFDRKRTRLNSSHSSIP